MKKHMRASTAPVALNPAAMAQEGSAVAVAFEEVRSSFDKFCLIAGIEALQELLQEEAAALCGERHQRHAGRRGRRWGETRSPVAFHGGRVGVDRPRVRSREGQQELVLPSWAAAQDENWLSQWAMNQMLINVSTRKFRRSVRLPGGDVGSLPGETTHDAHRAWNRHGDLEHADSAVSDGSSERERLIFAVSAQHGYQPDTLHFRENF